MLTEAYKREMALMPVILEMEQRGIKLDGDALAIDTDHYWGVLDELDDKICSKLGRQVDVDAGEQLADALEAAGLSKGFASTPTGRRSTAKDSLIGAVADPELLGHLLLRGSIATCLRTFMQPWLVQYQNHGRLYMKWNQIRNYTDTGARTGRLSSSPNLQNIPVEWEGLKEQLKRIEYAYDEKTLPQVRKYIVPDNGMIFVGRDYSAQEMRLLAHFTDGALLKNLQENPYDDVHQIAARIAGISRRVAKTLGFAVLYGAGVGRVAETLGISTGEATGIKNRYLDALPEIKAFQRKLSADSKARVAIETLGGRHYHAQPPLRNAGGQIIKTFEYKLANYKIQGSAADQTKQAMLDFARNGTGEIVLSVHDQLVVQCRHEDLAQTRGDLESAMNGSFAETLKYKVISEETIGSNFAEL